MKLRKTLRFAIPILLALAVVTVATFRYCASQHPHVSFCLGNVGLMLTRGHIRYWSLAWHDGYKLVNGVERPVVLTQDPPDSPIIRRRYGYRIIPSFTYRSYKPGCPPVATPWGPTGLL